MNSDYKLELNKLVQLKKAEIPTSYSKNASSIILEILKSSPEYIASITDQFDEISSLKPLVTGKRSLRETLIHMLNFEGLNYTTIYPAFLLKKPVVYPIHAERGFDKLGLFSDFSLKELSTAFFLERRKTLNFLFSLETKDWQKPLKELSKSREETIYRKARELAIHDFTHVNILKLQTKV